MVHISKLPEEIFGQILGFLDGTAAASHLLQTCRLLQGRTEQHLYRDIEFTWYFDKHHPPIAPLLYTLATRRDLARFVHTFALEGHKNRGSQYLHKYTRRTRDPAISLWANPRNSHFRGRGRMISNLLEEFRLTPHDIWTRAYQAGEVDVVVSLIVLLLSNLRILRLSTEFQCDTKFVGGIFFYNKHLFPSLAHVLFGADVVSEVDIQDFTFDTRVLTSLFDLPSLVSLECVMSTYELMWETRQSSEPASMVEYTKDLTSETEHPNDLAAKTDDAKEITCKTLRQYKQGFMKGASMESNLQTLSLRFCKLREAELTRILSTTSNLSQLNLHIACDIDHELPTTLCVLSRLMSPLKAVSQTLEHLNLSVCLYSVSEPFISGSAWTEINGDLLNLHKLRSLKAPLFMLLGWEPFKPALADILPDNLKELHFTDDTADMEHYALGDDYTLQVLRDYFSAAHNEKRQLTSFALTLNVTDDQWHRDKIAELKTYGTQCGIRCTVIKNLGDL